jgi:hypothetical protein
MQYEKFHELHEQFPAGRYEVNSLQLLALLSHSGFKGVEVRVLHLGSFALSESEVATRLRSDQHPRLDGINITCLEGIIIIDEPSHNHD